MLIFIEIVYDTVAGVNEVVNVTPSYVIDGFVYVFPLIVEDAFIVALFLFLVWSYNVVPDVSIIGK
jgi:hypothetical protein